MDTFVPWQFSPDRLVEIASARLPEHFGEFSLGGLERLLNQVITIVVACGVLRTVIAVEGPGDRH